MATKRYAHALVSKRNIEFERWMDEIRVQNEGAVSKNHINRVAKTIIRKADPKKYLLSHATIVASVDTYSPKGVKLGRQLNRGVQIDVKYPDFRVKPYSHEIINNNGDCWDRPLLLSTYRTFIGAPNYCFVPGTHVLMGDGTQKAIEEIVVGDEVIGSSGLPKKVVHKHIRDYDGEVKLIYVGHRKVPIVCTPNHPFARLDRTNCISCGSRLETKKRPSSYKKRIERQFCVNCGHKSKKSSQSITPVRVPASELEPRAVLFAPIPKLLKQTAKDRDSIRLARLMGFYLAEGCLIKHGSRFDGVVFTVGSHETDLIQQILDCVRSLYPESKPVIETSKQTLNCVRIKVYNTELATILYHDCGEHSYLKKLSTEWMNNANSDEVFNLIGSYISGDADVHGFTQRVRLCSVSLDLLQQIQFLGSCVGLSGFIVKHSANVGDVSTVSFADGSIHNIVCKHQAYVLHFDVASSSKVCGFTTLHKKQSRNFKSGDLKFLDDKKITFVNKIESDFYKGKVYNLEVEDDHSYIIDGVVQCFNCEHIQLPELSKGFIIDAISRDLGNTCYVDILVGTERKHKKLVSDILSGKISSMSMGCLSQFTICTKCGNVAIDDAQLCPCIQYEGKGTKFIDENGIEHPISELIGHVSSQDSNQFIEASWVENPAFKGAVRRNFLNGDSFIIANKIKEAHGIYEIRKNIIENDDMKRAASIVRKAESEDSDADNPDLDNEDTSVEDESSNEGDSADEGLFDSSLPSSGSSSNSSDENQEDTESDEKPSGSESIDELIGKAQNLLLETLVKSLEQKLQPKSQDVKTVVTDWESSNGGNDNLVRSSQDFSRKLRKTFSNKNLIKWADNMHKIVHIGGMKSIRSNKVTSQDLIILSWIEDRVNGLKYSSNLYKVAMSVGSPASYPSKNSFFAACEMRLGRATTKQEQKFFNWKGRIASLVEF